MSIGRPPPASAIPSGADILDEEAEAETDPDRAGATPADVRYTFGRLFLRPVNVAQLLTVLQGWSAEPAVITRERTSLRLTATASPSVGARPLSSFLLTGTFTAKTNPYEGAAAASAGSDPSGDMAESTYIPGDIRSIELELVDSELVMLTVFLEAALRDLFGIEHAYHKSITRRALQRQRDGLLQRSSFPSEGSRAYASAQVLRGAGSSRGGGHRGARYRSESVSSTTRSPAAPPPRQPQRESVEEDLTAPFDVDSGAVKATTAAAAVAAVAAPLSVVPSPAEAVQTRAAGGQEAAQESLIEGARDEDEELVEVDEEVEVEVDAEEPDGGFSVDDGVTPSAAVPSQPAREDSVAPHPPHPAAAAPEVDEEEFEEVEVLEEVEVEVGDEDDTGAGQAHANLDGTSPDSASGAAADTVTHGAAAATSATTEVRRTQHGELELESEEGYMRGRTLRGENYSAADVSYVGKAFGLDVVQSTKMASLSGTTATGAHVTGTATVTSGNFRAEGGGLTGSYRVVEEKLETTRGVPDAGAGVTVGGVPRPAAGGEEVGEADASAQEEAVTGERTTAPPSRAASKKGTGTSKKKGSRKKRKTKGSKKAGKKESVIDERMSL